MGVHKLKHLRFVLPLSVAISLLYEVAYFWGLGISIAETPLSAIDFVRGWMEWGTYSLSFILGVASAAFVGKAIKRTSEERSSKYQNLEVLETKGIRYVDNEKLSEFADNALRSLCFVTLAIVFLFGEWFLNIALIGFVYIAIRIYAWFYQENSEEIKKEQTLMLILFVSIVYIFIVGFTNGAYALNSKHEKITMSVKVQDNEDVKLLRFFDSWVLSKNKNNSFSWINNQSQIRVDFLAKRAQFIGLLCLYKRDYQFARNWDVHHCKNLYSIN